MIGKPHHYVLGAAAGLATAGVAGALLISARIGFFGLFGSILIGFLVSSAVLRTAARQRHAGIQVIAALSAAGGLAVGAMLAGLPAGALVRGGFLLPLVIASASAAFFSAPR